jgi:hypothetical protein
MYETGSVQRKEEERCVPACLTLGLGSTLGSDLCFRSFLYTPIEKRLFEPRRCVYLVWNNGLERGESRGVLSRVNLVYDPFLCSPPWDRCGCVLYVQSYYIYIVEPARQ